MLQYFRERKFSLSALLLLTVVLLFTVPTFQPTEPTTITTAEITSDQAIALYSNILITENERELGRTLFSNENLYSLLGSDTTILDHTPFESSIRSALALNADTAISELAVSRGQIYLTLFDPVASTRIFYYFESADGSMRKSFAQYRTEQDTFTAVFSVDNEDNTLFHHNVF